MSEFVIYGLSASPFVRSVRMALEEKGKPYRLHEFAVKDVRGEEHLKVHPFGRMPAVDHGGFRFYETQAILRYIDALYPEPALQPTELQAIARMNQIIGINDWYLFPQVARVIVFQRIVGPTLMGLTPDEAVIAAAVPDAKLCLGELNRLLGDQEFLAGDKLSLADLQLAPQLFLLAATPEGSTILAGTALEAWLGRMNARDSAKATLPPSTVRSAA